MNLPLDLSAQQEQFVTVLLALIPKDGASITVGQLAKASAAKPCEVVSLLFTAIRLGLVSRALRFDQINDSFYIDQEIRNAHNA